MVTKSDERQKFPAIDRIAVAGFKSIRDEQYIDVKKLTILAGANSSGKTSMMQPLLLMKQTLEAPFDPGPLLLNGPNVKFTMADQLLSIHNQKRLEEFSISFSSTDIIRKVVYKKSLDKGLDIKSYHVLRKNPNSTDIHLSMKMTQNQLRKAVANHYGYDTLGDVFKVIRNRCVLQIQAPDRKLLPFFIPSELLFNEAEHIQKMIHLPGLRGNPERYYSVAAVGKTFPGSFLEYTASIIADWQKSKNKKKLIGLFKDLDALKLTWTVEAHYINDTQVELLVGRLPKPLKGEFRDLVSIADVGFGVSQSLPVVTALHVAEPNQIVYLEQPEIHLHPRAQAAMAEVLADAAKRGICVIVETHSRLLLLSIQALVAEGKLPADLVGLNWFERDKHGITHVTQRTIDEYGRFGDWPVDFGEVDLDYESRFMDAVDKRMAI